MICHGRGSMPGNQAQGSFADGCCIWDNHVCPNRWYLTWNTPDGEIFDASGQSLGTVTAYIQSQMPGGGQTKTQRVNRVLDQVRNIRYVCAPAAYVIGMDPSLITNRAQFEAAWSARAEYTPVGDYWVSVGKPRNWCMSFGPTEGQCCYGESQVVNDQNRSQLHTSAVEVRRRATGAS